MLLCPGTWGRLSPGRQENMPEAGPQVYQNMKARMTLARKGIRGELENKSKMIQGKDEGTAERGAFGGLQVMTYT